jgi:trimeric autotransporter adhesin
MSANPNLKFNVLNDSNSQLFYINQTTGTFINNLSNFNNTTVSTNLTTASTIFLGGVNINCTSNSTDTNIGGAMSIAGGLAVAKDALITRVSAGSIGTPGLTSGNIYSTSINSILINSTDLNVSGNVTIGGNLLVLGQTTIINLTTANQIESNVTSSNIFLLGNLIAGFNSHTLGNIFTTGGNVGIGTTTPNSRLVVNGSIRQTGTVSSDYSNYMNVNASALANATALNPGILLYSANNQFNYGMDLGHNGGKFRTRLFAPNTHDISFAFAPTAGSTSQSGFTDSVVIKGPTGFVGIGTTEPGYTLDVNGSIDAGTFLTSGNVYSANVTSTNIVGTTSTLSNIINTNITTNSLVTTSVSSGNIFSTNLTSTNIVGTNISSSTLNLTSITTSSLLATTQISTGNVYSTNISSTNIVGTNISSSTLNLNTLTTGSLLATIEVSSANLYSTNISSTNIVGTNISSSTLNLSTLTTGSLLATIQVSSGNLYSTNVSSTNIVGTNISSSTLIVNNSLRITNTVAASTGALRVIGAGSSAYLPATTTIGQLASFCGPDGVSVISNMDLGTFTPQSGTNFLPGVRFSFRDLGTAHNSFDILTKVSGATGTMASRLFINGSGNIGIGTTAPGYTLDVNGSIDAGTFLTSGNVYSTNVTTTNIVGTNITSTNIMVTTLSASNFMTTNITTVSLLATTSMSSANVYSTNVTSTNIVGTNISSSTLNLSTMTSESLLATTSLSSGNLYSTNVTSTNIVGTNISSSTLNVLGITVGSVLSTSITTTSLLASTSVFSTGITSGTGLFNNSLTSGSIFTTALTTGTIYSNALTIGTILATGVTTTSLLSTTSTLPNTVSTNISSTSLNVTNEIATNISSSTINTTELTSGNINFTGSLYQNGQLYISSQFTTFGNDIAYTRGNIGINTTSPTQKLDVNGGVRIQGTTFSTNSTSGALVSLGGVSITGTTASSSTNGGALTVNGGTAVSGDTYVGGNLYVQGVNSSVITANELIGTNSSTGTYQSTVSLSRTMPNTNYKIVGNLTSVSTHTAVFAVSFCDLTTTTFTANIMRLDALMAGWNISDLTLSYVVYP